jgi:hypothetical protein
MTVSLAESSATCNICGAENRVTREEEQESVATEGNKPRKKSKILSVMGSIATFFLAIYFGFQYFGHLINLNVELVEKTTIQKSQMENGSEEELNMILINFNKYLEGKQWVRRVSNNTNLNIKEVERCLSATVTSETEPSGEGYYSIEFICQVDFKKMGEANDVVKAIKQLFEQYKLLVLN